MRPHIELKSIRVHVGLSEETPAYTASLYVDGVHVADVSNQGHGGPDRVYPPKGIAQNDADFLSKMQKLEERIATTYPKEEYEGLSFSQSLESICHELVGLHTDQRNMKSRLSRSVMILDGKILRTFKGKRSVKLIEAVQKKYPEAIVLNNLAFDKAWKIIQQTV